MLKSKKLVIVFLVFIFMMPGVCAYWFYQHPNWLSGAATNKGQLLTPPVLVKALPETDKWGLLLWSPYQCTQVCQQQLTKLTQIRLALGRRFYHVNLWLLTNHARVLSEAKQTDRLRQKGIHAMILPVAIAQKRSIFTNTPRVFIVNPDNYFILSYELTADPDDIYSDLQQVMKVQRSL